MKSKSTENVIYFNDFPLPGFARTRELVLAR